MLKRALELSPHSDEAHRRLGVAYQELGNRTEAIANLRKAVEVNPYFWVNHNQLGEAYLHFGDTEKSLEEFRRVTELEPRNPVGYDNIGSGGYFARGEWEKGIPVYEQSLKLQPRLADVLQPRHRLLLSEALPRGREGVRAGGGAQPERRHHDGTSPTDCAGRASAIAR